jgi:hypothetical protein
VQYVLGHAGIVIDKFQVHGISPGASEHPINLKGYKTAISSIKVERSRRCYQSGEFEGLL